MANELECDSQISLAEEINGHDEKLHTNGDAIVLESENQIDNEIKILKKSSSKSSMTSSQGTDNRSFFIEKSGKMFASNASLSQFVPATNCKGSGLDNKLLCDNESYIVKEEKERERIYSTERANLITLFKLVNKALIESSIAKNRMVEYDDNRILHDFFHVLEQIFFCLEQVWVDLGLLFD